MRKRKWFHRLAALGMAGVLAASLAGCSGGAMSEAPIFDSLRAEKAKILRKIKGFGFLRLAYFFCLFRFSKIFFHLF